MASKHNQTRKEDTPHNVSDAPFTQKVVMLLEPTSVIQTQKLISRISYHCLKETKHWTFYPRKDIVHSIMHESVISSITHRKK